jgi:hypothetical protein
MKNLILLALLAISSILNAQTIELEKEYINIDVVTNQAKYVEWSAFTKTNPYPKLPYNSESKKLEWVKVFTFDNMPKKQIMTRLKEWTARSFGRYDSVNDYIDEDAGKLIVKGYFDVAFTLNMSFLFVKSDITNNVSCYSTYVFTVKDNALKMEILHPNLELITGGYSAGTTYIPLSKSKFSIMSYFPIFRFEPKLWKSYFNLMNDINSEFNSTFNSIETYIKSVEKDYKF